MSKIHTNRVLQAYIDGLLNEYLARKLAKAIQAGGLTDDLVEDLIQDAQDASGMGVMDDNTYRIYFFTNGFANDILKDTFGIEASPEQKRDLCHYVLSHRDSGYDFKDLMDYRILTHKWLCNNLDKRAYPNTAGKEDRMPLDNIDKWVATLKDIYGSLHQRNMNRSKAVDYFTSDWDRDEKQRFMNWMRYYEDGTTEKYNVKNAKLTKQADMPSLPQSWMNQEDRASDGVYMSTYKTEDKADDGKTSRERELERAKAYKAKMRSRLRSLKRLLDKYNDILPKQNMDAVFDEMHSLEKSINRLDVYASIQDCMIRSANRIRKVGFSEGAEYLKKVAEEPAEPVAPAPNPDLGVLPQSESKVPDLQPGTKPAFSVNTIIDRLEGTSKLLKSRDMIRELASVDILLNELGMASYFPELTDAQAKLIEAFGYASNKIESIVAKLRGSGTSKPANPASPQQPQAPAPQAPKAPQMPVPQEPIETGEAMNKPVGKVKQELPTKPE